MEYGHLCMANQDDCCCSQGYTTRIPFSASKATKDAARATFF